MSNDPKDTVIDYSRLRKQDTVKYSEQLERYEQVAYEGGYGADWLEEVGESVKVYASICEVNGNRPTFAGLMKYLDKKALNNVYQPPVSKVQHNGYHPQYEIGGYQPGRDTYGYQPTSDNVNIKPLTTPPTGRIPIQKLVK